MSGLLSRHMYAETTSTSHDTKPVFVANSSVALSPKEGSLGLAYMVGVVLGFEDPTSNVRTAPRTHQGANALQEFGSSRRDNTEHAR